MTKSAPRDYREKNILQHETVLKDIHLYLRNNFLAKHTLPDLCKQFGTNEYLVKLGFRVFFGTTVFTYLLNLRLAHARAQLLDKSRSIKEISEEVGYQNSNHFSTAFKRKYGLSPMEYRSIELGEATPLSRAASHHLQMKHAQPITWKSAVRNELQYV